LVKNRDETILKKQKKMEKAERIEKKQKR